MKRAVVEAALREAEGADREHLLARLHSALLQVAPDSASSAAVGAVAGAAGLRELIRRV